MNMNETYPLLIDPLTALAEKAIEIGTREGEGAADWVFSGSTEESAYRAFIKGIDDGDPEVLTAFRCPDLTGEWADTYAPRDLLRELELEAEDEDTEEFQAAEDAYETASYEAFWTRLETIARAALRGA